MNLIARALLSVAPPRSTPRPMVALALLAMSFDAGAASRHDRYAPPSSERVRAGDCVGSYNSTDGTRRFLINICERTVYVSVVEHDPMNVHPRCAVFGLQGRRYGKAYRPGEWYMEHSLSVSFDADKALNACARSGYEVRGGGVGEFIRVTKSNDD